MNGADITLTLVCVDYTGCVYRIDVQDAHSSYSRQFDHEDMRELTERLDAALNGSPLPPARNWRDDKYPDETLADREAPVFDIQPTGRHSDQWTLTISEIYDYRATIGQDQLENLAKGPKDSTRGSSSADGNTPTTRTHRTAKNQNTPCKTQKRPSERPSPQTWLIVHVLHLRRSEGRLFRFHAPGHPSPPVFMLPNPAKREVSRF